MVMSFLNVKIENRLKCPTRRTLSVKELIKDNVFRYVHVRAWIAFGDLFLNYLENKRVFFQ